MNRSAFVQGSLSGMRVWGSYAAIETLTFTILPWVLFPRERFSATYRLATFAAMIVLPLAGSVAGLVAMMLVRRFTRSDRAFATTDIVGLSILDILFTLNANSSKKVRGLPLFYLFAVDLVLLICAVRALRSRRAASTLLLVGAPLLSVAVLAPLWMVFDLGLPERRIIAITTSMLIFIAMLFPAIERRLGRMDEAHVVRLSSFCAAFLWLFALVAGMTLRWEPPRFDARSPSQLTAPPNVVLITMDTVRADHLPMYGYARDTAPKLSELARRLTLFEHSYSSSDITISSHGSILTGQYVSDHGAHPAPRAGRLYMFATPLKARVPTLAEMLAHFGYRTCAVVANGGYLSRRFGFSRGFDYYDDRNPPPCALANPFALRSRVAKYSCRGSDDDTGYRRASEINRIVVPLMKAAKRDGAPLFLFVNYMDAHAPYRPRAPFDRLFDGTSLREDVQVVTDRWWERAKRGDPTPTRDERELVISQYDGGISTDDAAVGSLVSEIDHRMGPNTLIIITGDHGEAFGEHHLIGHSDGVYQELTRVPLLIRFPFQRQQIVRTSPVSSIDIVPTVLRVVGLNPPARLPGVDLSAGEAPAGRIVFAVSWPIETWIAVNQRFDRIERLAIVGDHAAIIDSRGKREAYDLKTDPNELVNIFGHDPVLDSHLASILASRGRSSPPLPDGAVGPRDTERPEAREPFLQSVPYLRSIPYLQ